MTWDILVNRQTQTDRKLDGPYISSARQAKTEIQYKFDSQVTS